MYERMLDKVIQPTMEQFIDHCATLGKSFLQLNDFLTSGLGSDSLMRFPYGDKYGWGVKYSFKNRLLCDVFAEKDAFTVMMRLTNVQFASVYDDLTDYAQQLIDNKYPCGEGGWIHYRVLNNQGLSDVKTLLQRKAGK